MINFFPSPYPDELWYSVICRYHVHSGNYCAKHTLRQLYGDNFCAPSLMLCGPINTLLAQLPQGFLSAKDVVMQHTFYPYYARFFPTQRKRSTYAYVVNGNPLAVHRMGISQANGNHCSVMRYCPVCYQEDLQLYGDALLASQPPTAGYADLHQTSLLACRYRCHMQQRTAAGTISCNIYHAA